MLLSYFLISGDFSITKCYKITSKHRLLTIQYLLCHVDHTLKMLTLFKWGFLVIS